MAKKNGETQSIAVDEAMDTLGVCWCGSVAVTLALGLFNVINPLVWALTVGPIFVAIGVLVLIPISN